MDVQLAPARGAVGLGHVLPQDRDRLGAHDEHGAQVADQRRQDVRVGPSGQGVRRPDRLPLLTERAEQAADHLGLAVEGGEPLLQGPGEPQVAIDFEQLVAGEARRYGRRLRDRCGARWHDVNCSGRETWLDGAAKSSSGARRPYGDVEAARDGEDRKSTRLNSSHGYISYAVFCLKKKKKK